MLMRLIRQHLATSALTLVLRVVLVSGITLLLLEFLLGKADVPTRFPAQRTDYEFTILPWWACDERGCHYVQELVNSACSDGEISGRVCHINAQGFHDTEDFVWTDDLEKKPRILMLGDSFTFGMQADIGSSFVETLEGGLPHSVIWNAGIPGSGTEQALTSFNDLAPRFRPHLTVLGFFENDFDDNLLPIDSWLNAVDSGDHVFAVRKFKIDRWENVIELDADGFQLLTVYGKEPPANKLELMAGSTRLGTLAMNLLESLRNSDERFERRPALTRQYLSELRDAIAARNSSLLVLLIPSPEDIARLGSRFQQAKSLMRELGIAHLDLIPFLDAKADYMPAPDIHWNSTGHQKVGALLSECIEIFIASGDLADCEDVIMP